LWVVLEIVMTLLKKFANCESGATAIEYGLIAALIGVSIITIVQTVGVEVNKTFEDVDKGLKKRTV
jgi:pilus assembly protein Flp/PilA